MSYSLDQALKDATPDRFGARWAIAQFGEYSYVVTELAGERTYARQQKQRNGFIEGQTLKAVPEGLLWRPMSLTRAEPR